MISLTLEAIEDVVFEHKDVFVLVLLFYFEGHISRHDLVVGLIDETYMVRKLTSVFRRIKKALTTTLTSMAKRESHVTMKSESTSLLLREMIGTY